MMQCFERFCNELKHEMCESKNKQGCLRLASLNECSLEERFWAKVLQDEKGSKLRND